MKKRLLTMAILILLSGILQGCDKEPESSGPRFGTKPLSTGVPVYRLAVHPLHNPTKLMQAYQPLVEYLNSQINGVRFDLEASRDYANFEEKFRQRKSEFLLPNPWQTLEAMKVGYHVVVMAGEAQDFKGLFVVRRDSKVRQPADLRGKAVAYPSPTALAACIMPQYFLHGYGINIRTELENRYVGSQESAIMNAYLGKTAVGVTWPPPWRAFQKEHPREAAELKVIWETESLINNSVMVRDDVPPKLAQQVRALLLGLAGSAQGMAILAGMETASFSPASDADYDVVRQYVARFEREVRPVEGQ
jgi:phosphonate transport system substrate-binding protein